MYLDPPRKSTKCLMLLFSPAMLNSRVCSSTMQGKVGHFSLNVAGFYLWVCGCVMIVVAQIIGHTKFISILFLQDSSGRDLKSAQNTPSRQPLAPPNPTNSMAPPPLTQDNRTSILAGQDFSKKVGITYFSYIERLREALKKNTTFL